MSTRLLFAAAVCVYTLLPVVVYAAPSEQLNYVQESNSSTVNSRAVPQASCHYEANIPERNPDRTSERNPAGDAVMTGQPTSGRFYHVDQALKKANASYPSWYRGLADKGLADASSRYWYTSLISPQRYADQQPDAEQLYFGSLQLKPGETYPAHNHPAHEFYYVVSGQADWYVNDERQAVRAGSVIIHRPFDVHGWVNTSATEPLQLVWAWWLEEQEAEDVLEQSARFTNPDLFASQQAIKAHAVPLPKSYRRGEKSAQVYPGEYPVYGRLEGRSAFYSNGPQEAALDENDGYDKPRGLRQLITPQRFADGNLVAEQLMLVELELAAGAALSPRSHLAHEFYFVVAGQGQWTVNGEQRSVSAGSVIRHRPLEVHSVVNSSASDALLLIAGRWAEPGESTAVFDQVTMHCGGQGTDKLW